MKQLSSFIKVIRANQCGKCSGFWFSFGDLELGRVSSQRSESGHDIAGK